MQKCIHLVPVILLVLSAGTRGLADESLLERSKPPQLRRDEGEAPVAPEGFEGIRAKISKAIEETGVASISIAVARDGEIIWEEGFGWADLDNRIEATPHTMYRLASISKSITVTGLMVLVERGLVDLDRPVNDYLGKSKLTACAGGAEDATVERILFHTAGLPMHWNFFEMNGGCSRPGMDESIRRYGIIVTAPGEKYNYSNFGYGIIGYIISRASGMDYLDFMREEVFEPLGMTHTSVLVDSNLAQHVAQMYNESRKPIPPYDFDHRGASAVISSVHDLVRFGMFHLMNHLPGQTPILTDETLREMHDETGAQFPELEGRIVVDYLLGSFGRVEYGGYRFEVASGSMPGAASRLTLLPSENIASALVCNGANIDLWSIEEAVFEAMVPGFAEKTGIERAAAPEEQGMDSMPPESFRGVWSGKITTYAGTIPAKMIFSGTGEISMEIQGKAAAHLNVKTPLGEMGFQENEFKGLFMGSIDTPDARRAQHVVYVECRAGGRRITGFAAALAMNQHFCLPYWMELVKE